MSTNGLPAKFNAWNLFSEGSNRRILATGHDLDHLLHCERSSGQFLFDALCDAGAEFEIDVDGYPIQPI